MIMKGFRPIACATERSAPAAHLGGQFIIGAGFAARNNASELVNTLIEGRDAGHVERHVGELAGAAPQLRGNALDRDLHHRRRTLLVRLRIKAEKTPQGLDFPRLRQLHADDAGLAPHDAATADAGVKDCVTTPHQRCPNPKWHHNTVMIGRTWNLQVRLRALGMKADRSVVQLQGAWRIARSRLIKGVRARA